MTAPIAELTAGLTKVWYRCEAYTPPIVAAIQSIHNAEKKPSPIDSAWLDKLPVVFTFNIGE